MRTNQFAFNTQTTQQAYQEMRHHHAPVTVQQSTINYYHTKSEPDDSSAWRITYHNNSIFMENDGNTSKTNEESVALDIKHSHLFLPPYHYPMEYKETKIDDTTITTQNPLLKQQEVIQTKQNMSIENNSHVFSTSFQKSQQNTLPLLSDDEETKSAMMTHLPQAISNSQLTTTYSNIPETEPDNTETTIPTNIPYQDFPIDLSITKHKTPQVTSHVISFKEEIQSGIATVTPDTVQSKFPIAEENTNKDQSSPSSLESNFNQQKNIPIGEGDSYTFLQQIPFPSVQPNATKMIQSTSIPTAYVSPTKLVTMTNHSQQASSNTTSCLLQEQSPITKPSHLKNRNHSSLKNSLWSSTKTSEHNTHPLTELTKQTEIRQIARDFRHRRNKLQLTQQQVSCQLFQLGYTNFSQSTLSRFENLSLSEKNMYFFKPAIHDWMEHQKTDPTFFSEKHPIQKLEPTTTEKRSRPRLSPSQKETLRAYFQLDPYPLFHEINHISRKLGITERTVRNWFANSRQNQKRFHIKQTMKLIMPQ